MGSRKFEIFGQESKGHRHFESQMHENAVLSFEVKQLNFDENLSFADDKKTIQLFFAAMADITK